MRYCRDQTPKNQCDFLTTCSNPPSL